MNFNLQFDSRPCLDVEILDDEVVEGRETFNVTLSTSLQLQYQLQYNVSTVTITDSDSVLIATSSLGAYEFTYFSC